MSNTGDRRGGRPVRGSGWKFMAALGLSGLGLGLAVVGLNPGATSRGETFSDANAGVVTGIGIGLFVVGLMIAWKVRPNGPASRPEDEPGKRERMQSERSMLLWLFPIITLLFLYQSIRAVGPVLAGEGNWGDYLSIGLPVLYAWLAVTLYIAYRIRRSLR